MVEVEAGEAVAQLVQEEGEGVHVEVTAPQLQLVQLGEGGEDFQLAGWSGRGLQEDFRVPPPVLVEEDHLLDGRTDPGHQFHLRVSTPSCLGEMHLLGRVEEVILIGPEVSDAKTQLEKNKIVFLEMVSVLTGCASQPIK